MELGSWIPVDGTSSVVLECRDDPIASCLRRSIAPNARLDMALQRVDRGSDRLPMSVPESNVVSNQCSKRHTLRRRKRRVPTGSMSHRLHRVSIGGLVRMGQALVDQLFLGERVASFGKA